MTNHPNRSVLLLLGIVALVLAGPLCLPVAAQYQDDDTKGAVTLPKMATAAEMMTLSAVWNVTECCGWTGTWRRRPNTLIFDASWRHTNGTVASDIVRMASWNKTNGALIFTRDGNGGRYGGFLDATRRYIQRGNASWYPAGLSWSATAGN